MRVCRQESSWNHHNKSESLDIDDTMEITYKDEENNYSALTDVYFKIHYFIYDRPIYYGDRISDLN